ncbi:thiamine pyrophosphate-binding protein [Granulosicoccus antarcticus]|uniref:Acetolactate synthase large subunit IlvG n=1 Tax=Granulosicoccus antarcticus IMCC3135 TaxID=1192854 RepID=A0A2Z2NYL6_9GAMM|nr:thiamine pyrophosphate-binding protein [Granulosicoccus antarcticus]ASJ72857.1 Acetolactate synthase large subunit IlvG [Granulosicoccus antarcticus IMCC3135]
MRGADLLVKSLAAAGVTRIFSLSGNQIMPIYDACFDANIEIIHTRHEAAAVFMAEAYAQLTGKVAVAMVTAGAGAANTLGPLFTCSESQTPVLLLTGDSPVSQDGRGAFQELDQVPMTSPVTKLSFRPTRARDFGVDVARAIRTAQSGRPGPVHMALPFDLVDADISDGVVPHSSAFARECMRISEGDLRQISQTLAAAKRPLVICGPAMNETRNAGRLEALSNALDAPVVAMESPRGLRDPALGDFMQALAQADVIVNLGKRVDFTLNFGSFNPLCSWIVVEPDADERSRAHLNLNKQLAACFAADPRDIIDDLVSAASATATRSEWRGQVAAFIEARGYSEDDSVDSGKITPAQLCAAVQRQISKASKSVMICDGGEFGQWAQAATQADRRVINGISGAIGGGLCYGLGAKKADPDATVFALMGDGTVGFHFAEFETAARNDAPYVVVIGNDERWNAEHQIQMRDYGPDRLIGCGLSDARYDKAVKGLGGHGEYVTDLADLDAALDRAVKSGKVACVNVIMEGVPAPSGSAH